MPLIGHDSSRWKTLKRDHWCSTVLPTKQHGLTRRSVLVTPFHLQIAVKRVAPASTGAPKKATALTSSSQDGMRTAIMMLSHQPALTWA